MAVPADIEQLEFRDLSLVDVGQGQSLSQEAKWNQSTGDWETMIRAGGGMGYFTEEDGAVATAMLLRFGPKLCWVSMVLVTAAWRRRGLATRLLNQAIETAEKEGRSLGLDATEAGAKVYERLGFEPVGSYSRLKWTGAYPKPTGVGTVEGIEVCPLQAEDLEQVLAWDREAFGGDRAFLLRHQYGVWPEIASTALDADGRLMGYTLGRRGCDVREMGPIMAETEEVAEALYGRAMALAGSPLYLDVTEQCSSFRDRRLSEGWEKERSFLRMSRGTFDWEPQLRTIYATAGPDFG